MKSAVPDNAAISCRIVDRSVEPRQQVEFIHEAVIEMGGGAHGLRDVVLLESALARPQNQHAYGETDTFQLGASYA